MTDRDVKLGRLKEALKDALEKPPAKLPLRRHHDDDYWDEIVILAGPMVLHGTVVPRYKTSGLSGDEWRVSALLIVKRAANTVIDRTFHRMNQLLTHAPGFIYAVRRELLLDWDGEATFVVKRKGHELTERRFESFGDAAMGMFWHVVTANEGMRGVAWHHLTDDEELGHCQQVGCADPPVNFYKLTRIDAAPGRGILAPPKYGWEGQYTWYCARHTTRGDCGLEDADKNLVLVNGTGVSRPLEMDESPSALAGAIHVKLPDRE